MSANMNDMTKGSPAKLIFFFSIPILLGNIFQQLYSMVDTIIVGRFIDFKALAAVGATGSISFLILGFVFGLSGGFAVITAQRFGARDEAGLRRSVATTIYLCLGTTIIMTSLSMLTVKPLLHAMNTPEDIFADAYTYIMIIFGGIGASLAYNMLACILRALGDSKTPLFFLIISSVLNIILDLAFIIFFHMGVAGAAWATIISQGVSAVLCLLYIKKHYPILHLRKEDFCTDWHFAWKHLAIGLPMAFQFSITAIGAIILQGALNVLGSVKIAAFTVASKVEQLVSQPAGTFGVTMANYSGQNLGANQMKRIREGTKKSCLITLGFSVLASLILVFFTEPLTRLFINNTEPEVIGEIIAGSKQYLMLSALFFPFLNLLFIYRNVLQGMGRSFWPLMAGVAELFLRSIVAFTLPAAMGFMGICLAGPAAWIGACILLFISYRVIINKMDPSHKIVRSRN